MVMYQHGKYQTIKCDIDMVNFFYLSLTLTLQDYTRLYVNHNGMDTSSLWYALTNQIS